MKTDILHRTDVSILVRAFYASVRQHERLGPIFNQVVEDWETHLERLTDFWEMVLLQTGPGAGQFSPVPVHKKMDRDTGGIVGQEHFGNWLELWFGTINEKFEGRNADYAKEHARKMAHILFFRIMENRVALR